MDNADPTTVIILSEIVAIETVIIIFFAVFFLIKWKKRTSQLKETISDFEKNVPDRKSFLTSLYSSCAAIKNTGSEKIIEDLINHETIFFRSIIEIANNNKTPSIKLIENEIHNLVSPYAQLVVDEDTSPLITDKDEDNAPDIDSAIDDLLADEADDAEGDPALDLSEEIEELPEELLSEDNISETTPDKNAN